MRGRHRLAEFLGNVVTGFDLQITGDIDAPQRYVDGAERLVLDEWMLLSRKLCSKPPILYVTASPQAAFENLIDTVKGVEVGVHGLTHVNYTLMPDSKVRSDFKKISSYSRKLRFPNLTRNLRTVRIAADYFESDSSFAARWKPFTPFASIPKFYEYPVIPPSDTFFRYQNARSGKQIGPAEAAEITSRAIRYCREREMFCTLLLHPNKFVNELLRNIHVDGIGAQQPPAQSSVKQL